MAQEIQRPVHETVTPAVLKRAVWAGSNLNSFTQGSTALKVLAGIVLSAKQVRRMTAQIGQDRLDERQQQAAKFQRQTLMKRLASPDECGLSRTGRGDDGRRSVSAS